MTNAGAASAFLLRAQTRSTTGNLHFAIQCDATTAIAFSAGTTGRSRMKHIDQRQTWVRQLRDAALTKAVKVGTNDNLADLFTKILKGAAFTALRDKFMVRLHGQ